MSPFIFYMRFGYNYIIFWKMEYWILVLSILRKSILKTILISASDLKTSSEFLAPTHVCSYVYINKYSATAV